MPKTIQTLPSINTKTLFELDRIHFWEPFQRPLSNRRVTLREVIKEIHTQYRVNPKSLSPPPELHLDKSVVVTYKTINQREALKAVVAEFSDKVTLLTQISGEESNIPGHEYLQRMALHYAPRLVAWYFTLPPYQKRIYRNRYYTIYYTLGLYRYLLHKFKRGSARYYIGANDHSGLSQIGFVAARDAGLTTIYIQHAAVSDTFPPLLVDYALLDGADAADKYLKAGSTRTKIHLIGTMKYDQYLQNPERDKRSDLVGVCIGIAANNIDKNLELCAALKRARQPFCVRFHPAVSAEIRERFQNQGWQFSNPESENALDFILRCHTVISSDSTILLEAIVLKRRPLYFASDGVGMDYYGFLKAGILDKAYFQTEEVMLGLKANFNLEIHRRAAKLYCDTLYTEDEGKSTQRAVQIINALINR